MTEARIRTRPTGAAARVGRTGFPHVTSATGGSLDIVTSVSGPGFNPLDLLYASLSACLVLSARMAASRLNALDRLTEVCAHVTGEKAPDEPARVVRFNIAFEIRGDFDDATRHAIAKAAEDDICTISNTLRAEHEFVTTVSGQE